MSVNQVETNGNNGEYKEKKDKTLAEHASAAWTGLTSIFRTDPSTPSMSGGKKHRTQHRAGNKRKSKKHSYSKGMRTGKKGRRTGKKGMNSGRSNSRKHLRVIHKLL